MSKFLVLLSFFIFSFAAYSNPIELITTENREMTEDARNFRVSNKSGLNICELYMSPDYADSWGSDILGSNTFPNNSYINLRINSDYCDFDMKVVACSGQELETRIDVCRNSEVTIR